VHPFDLAGVAVCQAGGKLKVSGGRSTRGFVWDPASARALGEPFATFTAVHGLAIHDDTIAVATSDAVIVLDAHATRA